MMKRFDFEFCRVERRSHDHVSLRSLGLVLVMGLAACSSSTVDSNDADVAADGGQDSSTSDASQDASPDHVSESCTGDRPSCAFRCRGDSYLFGDCVDGTWTCPSGHTDIRNCPANSCLGSPGAGEVCESSGWACRPEQRPGAYARCPPFVCLTCNGWVSPTEIDGCRCTCEDGKNVRCTRVSDGGT